MRPDKALSYLLYARDFARRFSKDRSTQVGTLFLHPTDYTVLASGYNGQVRGAQDDAPERHERPLKYEYAEHAERNAIFNAAREHFTGACFIATAAPSMSSARAIISVGAKEVWFPHTKLVTDQLVRVGKLFDETGVRWGTYLDNVISVPGQERHGRKLTEHLHDAISFAKHHSKDPFREGAVILDPLTYTQLSQGYSGMPRGARDDLMERYTGALRGMWVEDAVRNAIYNKVHARLKGSICAVTDVSCTECLRGVAAVGSKHIVTVAPSEDFLSRWGAQLEVSRAMAKELSIEVIEFPRDSLAG